MLSPGQQVQLAKVGTLQDFERKITERHREEFLDACFDSAGCFKTPEEAEQEIATREAELISETNPPIELSSKQTPKKTNQPRSKRPLPFKDLIDPEEGSDD